MGVREGGDQERERKKRKSGREGGSESDMKWSGLLWGGWESGRQLSYMKPTAVRRQQRERERERERESGGERDQYVCMRS